MQIIYDLDRTMLGTMFSQCFSIGYNVLAFFHYWVQCSREFSLLGTMFSRIFIIRHNVLADFQYWVQCSREFSLLGTMFSQIFIIRHNVHTNFHYLVQCSHDFFIILCQHFKLLLFFILTQGMNRATMDSLYALLKRINTFCQ